MIKAAKIKVISIFEKKIIIISWLFEAQQQKKKQKMLSFDQKNTHQRGKHITHMDFAEHVRKSGVSENSKVYSGRFLRNGLHDRYCYISKSR